MDNSVEPDERSYERPTRDEVARRAYEISLSDAGGTPDENWRRAEEELAAEMSDAGEAT